MSLGPATNPEVKWISHRGVRKRAPENSLLAFQDAAAAGFDTLETDLRVTRDNVIVSMHDPDISRVTNGNLTIQESTFEQLREYPLVDGQPILRFEEFTSAFPEQVWILDIKPETARKVVDILAEMFGRDDDAWQRMRLLFWNRHDQDYAESLLPDVEYMARKIECYRAGIAALLRVPQLGGIEPGKTYGITAAFAGQDLFTTTFVKRYQQRDAGVLAFLPDTDDNVDAALQAGVDEILLNVPFELD